MATQKIILFDIDYTLFDVGYFDTHFYTLIAPILLLPEELLRKTSVDIIIKVIKEEGFLDIEIYLTQFLAKLHKQEHKTHLEEILFGGSFFKDGFYKEAEEALQHLKGKAKLGIFSQGDERFQGAKVDQSGLKDFFEKDILYIKQNKLDFLPLLKEKHTKDLLYLVDDKPGVLYEFKKHIPSSCVIWIKRGVHAIKGNTIEGFVPDKTITHLSEIIPLFH